VSANALLTEKLPIKPQPVRVGMGRSERADRFPDGWICLACKRSRNSSRLGDVFQAGWPADRNFMPGPRCIQLVIRPWSILASWCWLWLVFFWSWSWSGCISSLGGETHAAVTAGLPIDQM